jgi:hypothetical protein
MFEDNPASPAVPLNLTGTVLIRDSHFSNHTSMIGIRNHTGTLSSLVMENNFFTTCTNPAVVLNIHGSARVEDLIFRGNTLTNVATVLQNNPLSLFVGFGSSVADTPFVKITVDGNTFSGSSGIPIRLRSQGASGTLHAIVSDNTVSGITGTNLQAMRVDSGNSNGTSTVCLQVQNNSFTPSGSAQGMMVRRDITSPTPDNFGIVGLTPSPATAAQVISYLNSQNSGTSTVPAGITSGQDGFTSCTIP